MNGLDRAALQYYLGINCPAHSTPLLAPLLALKPRRVIFNPGAENPALEDGLRAAGIEVEDACTLVLLRTGQF